MSNAMTTHGMIGWSELMTRDPQQAVTFYQQVFGWTFERMDMPDGPYHVASAAGQQIGGIMALPEEAAETPPHWGQYVTVDDVDDVAAKVSHNGGQVLIPVTEIPNVGRFCLLQDPQGAHLSAIQYHPQGD